LFIKHYTIESGKKTVIKNIMRRQFFAFRLSEREVCSTVPWVSTIGEMQESLGRKKDIQLNIQNDQ